MKRKEFDELKTKDIKELEKKVEVLRIEITKTKAELKTNNQKNLKKAKILRKDLSQILTLISEKEIMHGKEKEAIK